MQAFRSWARSVVNQRVRAPRRGSPDLPGPRCAARAPARLAGRDRCRGRRARRCASDRAPRRGSQSAAEVARVNGCSPAPPVKTRTSSPPRTPLAAPTARSSAWSGRHTPPRRPHRLVRAARGSPRSAVPASAGPVALQPPLDVRTPRAEVLGDGQHRAGIELAGPGGHHHTVERRVAHAGVDRAAIPDGGDRATAPEVADDDARGERAQELGRPPNRPGHAQAVEAVPTEGERVAPRRGNRVGTGRVVQRGVKRGVEGANLRDLGEKAGAGVEAGQGRRHVAGGQHPQFLQLRADRHVEPDRPGERRTSMDDAVADGRGAPGGPEGLLDLGAGGAERGGPGLAGAGQLPALGVEGRPLEAAGADVHHQDALEGHCTQKRSSPLR